MLFNLNYFYFIGAEITVSINECLQIRFLGTIL